MSECDFTLAASVIETVKPGDLVLVMYGDDRRYFIRHDDGSGDLIAYRLRNGHIAYCCWSRSTSAPWLPMMRTQRGILQVIASNMPRTGREIDGLKAVIAARPET